MDTVQVFKISLRQRGAYIKIFVKVIDFEDKEIELGRISYEALDMSPGAQEALIELCKVLAKGFSKNILGMEPVEFELNEVPPEEREQ